MHITRLTKIKLLILFLIVSSCATHSATQLPFNKVIIWGHKLHTSTHSYVHFAFYKAFKHMGYDTHWLENSDNVANFDFSNSLFLTAGDVDQHIPLRDDCRYILHNCAMEKYENLNKNGNCIIMQVYTTDAQSNHDRVVQVEPFIFFNLPAKTIYMPWATDLLPHEIDLVKKQITNIKKEKSVYWVGTIWDGFQGNKSRLDGFIRACQENNINFKHLRSIQPEDNITLIEKSYMAPALQGQWQCEKGYIPCRIFKNISYGQFGITNSKYVWELFERKIVYNPDSYQLFYDAKKKIDNLKIDELYELMDFVKNKHTYINRINVLIDFINLVKPLKR